MISRYFGYVSRPGSGIPDTLEELAREKVGYIKRPYWRFNNHGFLADRDYPTPAGPSDFFVGIFGG